MYNLRALNKLHEEQKEYITAVKKRWDNSVASGASDDELGGIKRELMRATGRLLEIELDISKLLHRS